MDVDNQVVDMDHAVAVLPPQERHAIERMVEPHRRRRLLMRATTRAVLSSYAGVPGHELELVHGPNGKPALADDERGPWFSVSSRGGSGLLAVSLLTEVGVDIETVPAAPDAMAIARRFFDQKEANLLASMDEPQRGLAFLRYWTAKEAHAKATGRGIGDGGLVGLVLPAATGDDEAITMRDHAGRVWTLQPLALGPGHVGTLAVERPPDRFTWRQQDLDVVSLLG